MNNKYKILVGLVAFATVFNRFTWAELAPRIENLIYRFDMELLAIATAYALGFIGYEWAKYEQFKKENNNKFLKSLKGSKNKVKTKEYLV